MFGNLRLQKLICMLILINNEHNREEITGEPNSDLIFSITDDDPITPPEQEQQDDDCINDEANQHTDTVNTSIDEENDEILDENSVACEGKLLKFTFA